MKIDQLLLLLSAVIIVSVWVLIIFNLKRKTTNRVSAFWLSIFLFCLSLSLAEPFFERKLIGKYFHVLATFYLFVVGPSLLFYCKSKIRKENFKLVDSLHFLPLFIYLLYGFFWFNGNDFIELVVTESFYMQVMIYCFFSFELLDVNEIRINSLKVKRNFKVIKSIPLITGFVYMIIFFIMNFSSILYNTVPEQLISFIQILFCVYVLFVIFFLPDFNHEVTYD